jgi:RING finger/CHY zinc finger protein 1
MCQACDTVFAHYYCEICKVYSQKNAFHCDDCISCILGNIYEYQHCKKCNCCISRQKYDQHICIENRLDDNCSICCTSLKYYNKVVILKCGHSLHEQCKDELLKTHTCCPICKMSLVDLADQYKQTEELIRKNPIHNQKIVKIHCNDCIKQNDVLFHPFGTRCIKCYSFNTTLI